MMSLRPAPSGGLAFSPSTKINEAELDDLGVPVSAFAKATLAAMEEEEKDMFPTNLDKAASLLPSTTQSAPTSPGIGLKSIGSMRKMPSVRINLGDAVTVIPGFSADDDSPRGGTASSRASGSSGGGARGASGSGRTGGGGGGSSSGLKGTGAVFGPPKRMGSGRIVTMDGGGDVFLIQSPSGSLPAS